MLKEKDIRLSVGLGATYFLLIPKYKILKKCSKMACLTLTYMQPYLHREQNPLGLTDQVSPTFLLSRLYTATTGGLMSFAKLSYENLFLVCGILYIGRCPICG